MQKVINLAGLKRFSQFILFMAAFSFSCFVFADTTPNNNMPAASALAGQPIKIGMSASLTGGAAESGKNMALGIQVYFDKINANGGIRGRKLDLIALDDG